MIGGTSGRLTLRLHLLITLPQEHLHLGAKWLRLRGIEGARGAKRHEGGGGVCISTQNPNPMDLKVQSMKRDKDRSTGVLSSSWVCCGFVGGWWVGLWVVGSGPAPSHQLFIDQKKSVLSRGTARVFT